MLDNFVSADIAFVHPSKWREVLKMHVILYTVYHKSTLVMNQEIFLPVGWDIYIIHIFSN